MPDSNPTAPDDPDNEPDPSGVWIPSPLVGGLYPVILRYCRRRIGDTGHDGELADRVAEDLAVSTMVALSRIAEADGPGEPSLPDALDAAERELSAAGIPPRGYPDRRALLSKLPDHRRDIVTLLVLVVMSAEETSKVVGWNPGAVRVAGHRGMAKLKRMLGGPDDPD